MIERGDCDVALAGASEASAHSIALAGFKKLKALHFDPMIHGEPDAVASPERAERASRPFDRSRAGFALAEGAAVLILEERNAALRRLSNADQIYAEIRGYGLTADAYHPTAPRPGGESATAAMRMALRDAGCDKVDYVNAHAASTPLGDAAEASAIRAALGEDSAVAVSSTKGATGHLLGAAGALEAALTVLAVRRGVLPHTRNLKDVLDEGDGLDFVRDRPRFLENAHDDDAAKHQTSERRRHKIAALSNSFGFGGTNASLLFTSHHPDDDDDD